MSEPDVPLAFTVVETRAPRALPAATAEPAELVYRTPGLVPTRPTVTIKRRAAPTAFGGGLAGSIVLAIVAVGFLIGDVPALFFLCLAASAVTLVFSARIAGGATLVADDDCLLCERPMRPSLRLPAPDIVRFDISDKKGIDGRSYAVSALTNHGEHDLVLTDSYSDARWLAERLRARLLPE